MATTPNFGSQAWHRKGAGWEKAGVRESIEKKLISIVAADGIADLATKSFTINDVLIVKGKGTYLFSVDSTVAADGELTLAAANGRFLIENYGTDLVRSLVRQEITSATSDTTSLQTSSIGNAISSAASVIVSDTVYTGSVRASSVTVANAATVSFYVAVPNAVPGDNIQMTTVVPLDATVIITAVITAENEVRVQINNTSGAVIETPEEWNFAIIKQI